MALRRQTIEEWVQNEGPFAVGDTVEYGLNMGSWSRIRVTCVIVATTARRIKIRYTPPPPPTRQAIERWVDPRNLYRRP